MIVKTPKDYNSYLKEMFNCPYCIEGFNVYYVTSKEQRERELCCYHMKSLSPLPKKERK